jgi:hypothetical protein
MVFDKSILFYSTSPTAGQMYAYANYVQFYNGSCYLYSDHNAWYNASSIDINQVRLS